MEKTSFCRVTVPYQIRGPGLDRAKLKAVMSSGTSSLWPCARISFPLMDDVNAVANAILYH